MSIIVFFSIIFASFFQASWNFFAKKTKANKTALLLIGWLILGLIATPIAALFTDFSKFTYEFYLYITLSSFIHFIYICLLGWAYTVGEISVVYPIARGLGIALTALITTTLNIDSLSLIGTFGVFAIVVGSFTIGLNEILKKNKTSGVWVAVLVAITVSAYSISDSLGAQHIPPFFFIAVMNLGAALFATPLLLTKLRTPAIAVLKNHKLESLLVASGGSLSYIIILWAFTKTQTSYVVALREFSIVIASLLGFIFLKEKVYFLKLLGILLILVGMLIIKSQ